MQLPGLGDLLNLLDRWGEWKQMRAAPARIDAIEKRMAQLESQLEPAPGRRCEGCGKLSLRLESSRIVGPQGHKYTKQKWRCENEQCNRVFETSV